MAKAKNGGAQLPVKWDEELAKQAEMARKMEESTATGQFFSMRAGVLKFNDAPIPDNTMGVIIADAIMENAMYEGEFNPEQPTPPTCFAFGREDSDMKPHDVVIDKQNDTCKGCPHNEFGTADRGRGKSCKNVRRLALLPAGTFAKDGSFQLIDDPAHYKSAQFAYLKVPVTSVKGYSGFVKSVASVLRRPPHGVITKVTVVPDAKSQFKCLFEPINKVPDALMGAIMARHKEARELIAFPYQPADDDAVQARTKQGRGTTVAQKKASGGRTAPVNKGRPAVKKGAKY